MDYSNRNKQFRPPRMKRQLLAQLRIALHLVFHSPAVIERGTYNLYNHVYQKTIKDLSVCSYATMPYT